jgi:hypothetical protein
VEPLPKPRLLLLEGVYELGTSTVRRAKENTREAATIMEGYADTGSALRMPTDVAERW